ncbi:MAG TPA: 8-amino-7-oxononanoate synthase [Burkholderiales bacterium]
MHDLHEQLSALEQRGLRRRRQIVEEAHGPEVVVDGRELLAFCSNDYLGLAQHPALIAAVQQAALRYGVGSGASALISGHAALHEQLEERLAAFVGMPRALHFATGYMANLALLQTLARRGDAIFHDALNHASLIDGLRLSRAEAIEYPHCDVATLAASLAASTARNKFVVTDAVFSMDGDIAPLPELLKLCEAHDAWLIVDDAHGFGVLGRQGRGSLSHFDLNSPRIVYMGTLGKAAGVAGAFVAASAEVIDWLIQRARTYIYTTATPPLLAAAVLASVDVIEHDEARRTHLQSLISQLREGLRGLPWTLLSSQTAIQPLIVGESKSALELSAQLREAGIWVPAIRPPTVPMGTARLRISLSAAHTEAQVQRLVAALQRCAGRA